MSRRARVLSAGKMSVGKSTLINALWGHPDLVPTATRDCTQTNTLILPIADLPDGAMHVRYLDSKRACAYAIGSERWHRISEFVFNELGPFGPNLKDMDAPDALRSGIKAVQDTFEKNPSKAVLHDNLPEAVEVIEDLLEMAENIENGADMVVEKPFNDRSEFLMGRRRPDGRVAGEGMLMAQEWVELHVPPIGWGDSVPEILDTPWIPTIHDTRRVDLIKRTAENCDAIMVVILPGKLVLEDWLAEFLKQYPDRAESVIVVISQADTIDETRFFGRDGFVENYSENRRIMRQHGMDPNRLFVTVPWLSCLKRMDREGSIPERISRIEAVMSRILKKATPGRMPDELIEILQSTCDPDDCGIETLRDTLSDIHILPLER